MKKPTSLIGLTSFLCFISILLVMTFNSHSQNVGTPKSPEIDFKNFPIASFDEPLPTESQARVAREAKNKKFNSKAKSISESSTQIFTVMDWDIGLPTFPIERSFAVVIGRITEAKAFLSEDKTAIYSEFKVQIDSVLKNDDRCPIQPETSLIVGRDGGRVRLPSGKIVVSWINHQNMPAVGGKYALFLTHELPRGGDGGTDFYIVTAYELANGNVFPMDDIPSGHPIAAIKGRSESSFLNDLQSLLGSSPKLR
ncbi:MAG TPA: hypothetical protein VKB05_06065 [Pyrinomonadaceae bacterium]|nr:hypothetical protein [Pyrinomonadaceae bacterium]